MGQVVSQSDEALLDDFRTHIWCNAPIVTKADHTAFDEAYRYFLARGVELEKTIDLVMALYEGHEL